MKLVLCAAGVIAVLFSCLWLFRDGPSLSFALRAGFFLALMGLGWLVRERHGV